MASVSSKRGLVYLKVQEEAVNADSFKDYVIKLSKKMNEEPFLLFMDRLASHRTLALAQTCELRGITKCLNIGYCPQFNPIENTFAEVKRVFNKARLSALSNNEEFDMKVNIKKAFKVITP